MLKTKSIDGFSSTTDYPEIASESVVSLDETNREGPRALFSKRAELSKDMIKKLTKQFEDCINNVTERTGNVVKVDGRNQLSNPLIDMLKTEVTVDFDENGNAIMPTIFPPQGIEIINAKLKECQKDPEMAKHVKQLIEKKRKEWLDRENSRKLVD
jgi:hypothetical protein